MTQPEQRPALRTAIVTGAARGIGRAIAERLARDGHAVVIADINLAAAQATAAEIGAGAMALAVDVSDPASVRAMAASVLERFGRIDVLVNNAGITGPAASVADYPIDDWRRVMSINLDGVFYCCQAVLPAMLAQARGASSILHRSRAKRATPTCRRTPAQKRR